MKKHFMYNVQFTKYNLYLVFFHFSLFIFHLKAVLQQSIEYFCDNIWKCQIFCLFLHSDRSNKQILTT
jgi:hypothetical protein